MHRMCTKHTGDTALLEDLDIHGGLPTIAMLALQTRAAQKSANKLYRLSSKEYRRLNRSPLLCGDAAIVWS